METLLYPCAWAPTMARSMPPARPSKICPYRSTRKLYPTSFQPLWSMWYRAIASTMAAESSGPYSFAVTVWCDEGHLDLAVGGRPAQPQRVGAPGAAGDDRGRLRAAAGGEPRGARDVGRRVHETGAEAARRAAKAELELVGRTGPRRVRADRRPTRVGPVVAGDVQVRPAAPATAAPARADLRLGPAPAAPTEPDQVEAVRRADHAGGAPAHAGGDRAGRAGHVDGEREGGRLPRRPAEGGAGAHGAQRGRGGGAELQGLAAGEAVAGHVVRNTGEGRKDRRKPPSRIPGGRLQRSLTVVGSEALKRSPDSDRAGRRRGLRPDSRAAPRACR